MGLPVLVGDGREGVSCQACGEDAVLSGVEAGIVLDEGASWVPASGPQACGSVECPTPAWGEGSLSGI